MKHSILLVGMAPIFLEPNEELHVLRVRDVSAETRERLFLEQDSLHLGERHRCHSKVVNSKRSRKGKLERWN